MKRNNEQNRAMHRLFGLLNISDENKADLVASYTQHRTESTAEMTMHEAAELITYLNTLARNVEQPKNTANQMRMAVLSSAHTLRWYLRDDASGALMIRNGQPVLDYARIDKYCITHTAAKKKLNDQTEAELQKTIHQFKQMAFAYLKRK